MNNDIIIVNAYADSEQKKKILNECLYQLKKTGIDILLASHYPVPKEIQNLSNYFLYDKRNELFDHGDCDLYWYENSEIYLETFQKGIGRQSFAALRTIQNAVNFAKHIGKKFFYHLDYDCIISDIDLNKFKLLKQKIINDNKKGYIQFCEQGSNKNQDSVICNFFAFYIDFFEEKYGYVKDINEYKLKIQNHMLEFYMYDCIKDDVKELITEEGKSYKIELFNNSINDICISNTNSNIIDILKDFYSEDIYLVILAEKENEEYYIEFTTSNNENINKNVILKKMDCYYENVNKIDSINIKDKNGNIINLFCDIQNKKTEYKNKIKLKNNKKREILVNNNISSFYSKIAENETIRTVDIYPDISYNFINGAFVELRGYLVGQYTIKFIDKDKIIHQDSITVNHWVKTSRQWFAKWKIQIEKDNNIVKTFDFDLNGKRVLISFDSSSLGDNLAWIPYVEEFRKKHNCHVICSSFLNHLFEKEYKDIEFVNPGSSVYDIYAQYNIGWYSPYDTNKNPNDYRIIPLQQTASDILGLDFKEIKPNITIPNKNRNIEGKYVCLAIQSTAQAKYWNYQNGWQEVVDYLNSIGYKVVYISKEKGSYMGNPQPTGIIDKSGNIPIEDRIIDLKYADMFIGVGSGLSWLSWAVGTPTVLISGFSKPFCEPNNGIYRVINENVCNGCFNDSSIEFDRGDWNWCPRHKNFECTKSITPDMVIKEINKVILDRNK